MLTALETATEPTETELNIYDVAAELYDVEKELLEAIERHETGHYTSTVYKNNKNTWGCIESGSYRIFDSVEQSTLELARCLRLYYYNEGLTELEAIATKFCPNDAAQWAQSVGQLYNEIKGV